MLKSVRTAAPSHGAIFRLNSILLIRAVLPYECICALTLHDGRPWAEHEVKTTACSCGDTVQSQWVLRRSTHVDFLCTMCGLPLRPVWTFIAPRGRHRVRRRQPAAVGHAVQPGGGADHAGPPRPHPRGHCPGRRPPRRQGHHLRRCFLAPGGPPAGLDATVAALSCVNQLRTSYAARLPGGTRPSQHRPATTSSSQAMRPPCRVGRYRRSTALQQPVHPKLCGLPVGCDVAVAALARTRGLWLQAALLAVCSQPIRRDWSASMLHCPNDSSRCRISICCQKMLLVAERGS